ncbi:hypothetical protein YC2023_081826 [Brassica napus]
MILQSAGLLEALNTNREKVDDNPGKICKNEGSTAYDHFGTTTSSTLHATKAFKPLFLPHLNFEFIYHDKLRFDIYIIFLRIINPDEDKPTL